MTSESCNDGSVASVALSAQIAGSPDPSGRLMSRAELARRLGPPGCRKDAQLYEGGDIAGGFAFSAGPDHPL